MNREIAAGQHYIYFEINNLKKRLYALLPLSAIRHKEWETAAIAVPSLDTSSHESINEYGRFSHAQRKAFEILRLHNEEIVGVKYSIALNVSAMVEALANFIISENTERREFEAFEKFAAEDKWLHLIKRLVSPYEFPSKHREMLTTLIKTRNAITHMKPRVTVDGAIEKRGLLPDIITHDDSDMKFINGWVELPQNLIDDLCEQIGFDRGLIFKLFSGIHVAPADYKKWGDARLKKSKKTLLDPPSG